MMNSFASQQRQESLKRRWQERRLSAVDGHQPPPSPSVYRRPSFMANPSSTTIQSFPVGFEEDLLVSSVVPPVTVVLEGRSICQRISLHKHGSYQSLARALRQMFVDGGAGPVASDSDVDLSNAVPGHLIAYEDMENDLLLVGDLNWKDFVRVAKRIRVIPVKENSRKGRRGA
ncbi:auxin-responsive protein IAA33 [Diospyros lotus]|uniref:auxin-responsive protein IAA33 n=1 Tax=Diospyros lotus TaxID=55363 RepID=UPI0022508118|nr:auxin-responsive protein IAA33 [Diospyros lotus]